MGILSVDEASGYDCVELKHQSGATAKIHLHGGHLASCVTAAGNELIFMSKSAVTPHEGQGACHMTDCVAGVRRQESASWWHSYLLPAVQRYGPL